MILRRDLQFLNKYLNPMIAHQLPFKKTYKTRLFLYLLPSFLGLLIFLSALTVVCFTIY